MCIPQIDLSNRLSYAQNIDYMQKLQLQEVDVPTYPIGALMNFGASSPRFRFLDV